MSKISHEDGYKVFNDPVHGTIRLHPFLVKIIDSPEFQRLRHIKQLGGVYYVYPGAQHNRFEHSIGTAHLAGKLARHLKDVHSDDDRDSEGFVNVDISEKDILCVEIAGLCHDLGHGPFSHLFDTIFVKSLPGKVDIGIRDWKHEQGSCEMFDKVMEKESVKKYMMENMNEEMRLNDDDKRFIKRMIKPIKREDSVLDAIRYEGRSKEKSFLFEIISNEKSGVDVDKWDYFARDCHHLGIANGFDHNRFIEFTRVISIDEEKQICVRDKEVFNLYEMFHTRYALHRRAYQHKSVNAVEHMICDAMVAANDCVRILGNGDKDGCKISECIKKENLGSFCNLDDSILHKILLWNPEFGKDRRTEESHSHVQLKKAKDILQRLGNGKRYKCVGNKILGREETKLNGVEIKKAIAIAGGDEKLAEKLRVLIIKFNYGSGDKDPIENYRFYKKGQETKGVKIQKEEVSFLLPDVFEEKVVQVFCISEDEEMIEAAEKAFKKWYKNPKSSTKHLLRQFLDRTEQLKITDANVKEMITGIYNSLDKK